MLEFLEANWTLLLFGAMFLLMVRMHAGGHSGAHGGGCCGGHSQANRQNEVADDTATAVRDEEQRTERERQATAVGWTATEGRNGRHSAGCH
jgi:hypothetical protein